MRTNEIWSMHMLVANTIYHYVTARSALTHTLTGTGSTYWPQVCMCVLVSPAKCVSLPLPSHHSSIFLLLRAFIVLQGHTGLVCGTGLNLLCQLGSARLPLEVLFWVVPLQGDPRKQAQVRQGQQGDGVTREGPKFLLLSREVTLKQD